MLIAGASSTGTIAAGLLQSMLDDTEERRRREEQEKTGQTPDAAVEARISASQTNKRAQEKISEALFSVTKVDANALKVQLYQSLGKALGVEKTEDMSSYAYGRAIETALADLSPQDTIALTKDIGLDTLGLKLSTVIEAIKNPSSDSSVAVQKALEKQHGDGTLTGGDAAKVLQRLEDVANPKTLAELKLGEQGFDPTRVSDAETEAEQQDDIAAREASAKLDSVQAMHRAIRERNDRTANDTDASADDRAQDVLATLAAAVETSRTGTARDTSQTTGSAQDRDKVSATGKNDSRPWTPRQAEEDIVRTDPGGAILAVSQDEIGLYRLLKPKTAGAAPIP
ncbi:hypothetical protein [Rhizobium straminoryzae]|uniref:Uncharacterized protein n=1 Tax=Rhizobium straminoryzae TaxID=1387186 RepID=A0A549TEA3_9HYPH|nr:hypothetical protein [Rhizobium straminoryzae]TRL40502.1 hypothetical protein FNA46_06300 [Rhizobium straminoryzae]